MNTPKHFISSDWGTSNFRLRVVVTNTLEIVAEHTSGLGIRELNERFEQSGEGNRLAFYSAYLQTQLAELRSLSVVPDTPARTTCSAPPTAGGTGANTTRETTPPGRSTGGAEKELNAQLPVVISGMASANIGMYELPYATLPITATARNFVTKGLTLHPCQHLRLISGVQSENGMMRGEETQALGLLPLMAGEGDGTLLLPGTHSKHLSFVGDAFTGFASYMTGELFEIISRRSILANSVASGAWNERTGACFRQAVLTGCKDGFSSHLFAVRAGHVLRETDPTDNFYRLSGLLIGDELSHLPNNTKGKIYLAGSGPLLRLYRYALEILGFGERLTVYADEALEAALLAGQREILLRKQ
ncbi:2-dehydro-3-deoxygalactonokinase [Neolewinella aurantiaca]|uniref:2-dehydro-3-deoxygalactonokinase n=1 Tax=Neolewinella aurantiaca TaxID=2602767 RepID=A0A5C7FEM4_9BACT|nr:2-dehydro-3-deoxygalactonokinase [Neolewinella aurantiaca]TXF87973.1 2-dehydro-3-deoxygalactonokinase [Neolewinella aurantiaca]